MFLQLLKKGNQDFERGIDRGIAHFRTTRLKTVVAAIRSCQSEPTIQALKDVLTSLDDWRTHEPHEFKARGETKGVAYRAWMEAKQMLRNKYGDVSSRADPNRPEGCPGTLLNNIYVPPLIEEGQESKIICHQFTYHWLVAAGKLKHTLEDPGGWRGDNPKVRQTLFPLHAVNYESARKDYRIKVQAGDLVGIFSEMERFSRGNLQHSVIARTSGDWFGANNTGTFGKPLGLTEVNILQSPSVNGWFRWKDGGSEWIASTSTLMVVYRRF